MAGMSSSAARWIRSSGSEAPSRKLNALAACNSIYRSVIQSLYLPTILHKITGQAATKRGSIMAPGHQIPLFERPQRRVPPISGGRPGSVSALDCVSLLAKDERIWLPVMYVHHDYFRWTKLAHGQALWSHFPVACDRRGHNKGLYTKTIRAIGVFEHCLAHASLAHDTANPGQRHIQPHGLRHL